MIYLLGEPPGFHPRLGSGCFSSLSLYPGRLWG